MFATVSERLQELRKDRTQSLIVGFLGVLVFVLGTTYGDFVEIVAQLGSCRTSGCARSYGFGAIFLLGLYPPLLLALSGFAILLMTAGLKIIRCEIRWHEPLLICALPFLITTLPFIFMAQLIHAPGYQTDLRFLFLSLVKSVLLCMDALILIAGLRLMFRLSWSRSFVGALPMLIYLSVLQYFNIMEQTPYWHYLNEERTWELLKIHLVGG